jgi:hypothetical protein
MGRTTGVIMSTPTRILSEESGITPTDSNAYGTSYGVKNMTQQSVGGYAYGVYGKGPAYVANRAEGDQVPDYLINYRLDGTDSITPVNSPTLVQGKECPDHIGSSFDGVNQYYNADVDASIFNGIQTGYTVTLWINTTDTGDVLIGVGSASSGGDGFNIRLTAGGAIQHVSDGNFTGTNTVFNDGIWRHFAMTYNGTQIALYVNAILEKSPTITHTTLAPTTFKVAAGSAGAGQYYNGIIDGVRVYDRVLSQPEIQSIYEYTCT